MDTGALFCVLEAGFRKKGRKTKVILLLYAYARAREMRGDVLRLAEPKKEKTRAIFGVIEEKNALFPHRVFTDALQHHILCLRKIPLPVARFLLKRGGTV